MQEDPRPLGRPHELDSLALGVAERLLDEHVLAELGRRQGDRRVTAGGGDQDGVCRAVDGVLPALKRRGRGEPATGCLSRMP